MKLPECKCSSCRGQVEMFREKLSSNKAQADEPISLLEALKIAIRYVREVSKETGTAESKKHLAKIEAAIAKAEGS